MNGLELAKSFYAEYGKPMLENEFSDILKYLAVGFVGKGSEHFGFDDEISVDHDYEPGFEIFIPGENIIDRQVEFRLERAYAKLPKEYKGFKRQNIVPVGGHRNGIIRTADFYKEVVGTEDGQLSVEAWLHIPDYALAEAVNGEVFFDEYKEFSHIREILMFMPEDIKLKRIAGNLLIMAQSGQYNFLRCVKHNERQAAQLAAVEFVQATMKVLFLLNDQYMPFYKWSFKALKQIYGTEKFIEKFTQLLYGDNSNDDVIQKKYTNIEEVASMIITLLQDRKLTDAICGDLEKHAYSVNDKISESTIRNMHILEAV